MGSGLIVSRFSPPAREIVCGVVKPVSYRKADKADTTDLLASMADSKTKPGEALRSQGVTYGEVMTCIEYHKQKFGGDVSIPSGDDSFDVGQIFSTDGKRALLKAITLADLRDKPEVTEGELFDVLTGASDLRSDDRFASQNVIQRIVNDLGITVGDLKTTLTNLQSQSLSLV